MLIASERVSGIFIKYFRENVEFLERLFETMGLIDLREVIAEFPGVMELWGSDYSKL